MSLLGVGAAKIDLILPKETYFPGEHIQGYFYINGGIIEQQLKRIECDLVMDDHSKGTETIVDSTTILTSQLIQSAEENKITFTFQLPGTVPVSSEEISYRFHTKLTFMEGVQSRDEDKITIIHKNGPKATTI